MPLRKGTWHVRWKWVSSTPLQFDNRWSKNYFVSSFKPILDGTRKTQTPTGKSNWIDIRVLDELVGRLGGKVEVRRRVFGVAVGARLRNGGRGGHHGGEEQRGAHHLVLNRVASWAAGDWRLVDQPLFLKTTCTCRAHADVVCWSRVMSKVSASLSCLVIKKFSINMTLGLSYDKHIRLV